MGNRIHSESGAKFFVHAAKALHTHDQYEKHLAYVYGVLCHFALDEICHGYVEQAVKETGLAHIAVEGELDRKLMIMNGENPVSRRLTGHIVPSMKNAIIIKDFYRGITAKEVKKALNGMVFYDRILVCPSKIKRMALYAALKVAGLYYDFHGFIIKYHENESCREQIRKLLHLYEKAVPLADKLICEYKPFLEGNATLDSVYAYTFGSQFQGLSDVQYLAYWGYAVSIATLLTALAGPVFGTVADTKGYKKPVFTIALGIGAIASVALGFAKYWLAFLVVFVIAKVGYSVTLVFYDSMLVDVTLEDRMDEVSSQGYAWGYIGSCVPFIICLLVVLNAGKIGITMEIAMMVSFVIITVWWVIMTLPLLKTYHQKYYVEKKQHAFSESFKRIGITLKNVKKEKKVFLFLLAFFFYIDGVYTIIDMATAYGSALGLSSTGLLLALLLTQIVAFPFAIIFGRLAKKYSAEKLITVCIVAYLGVAIFAIFLHYQWQFWVLAVWVGMFQGGVQALSRSYFTKIIPANQSGEFFGLMDICGKGASFMGTTIVSLISQLTGNINIGVGMIAVLFVIGIILFRRAAALE